MIHVGDCLEILPTLPAESVDSIVTDPPYGLSFMGKEWDSFKEGNIAMRRNPQMDAVNTGASRQGGRQRACADYQKRQARDMRAFQDAMNSVFIEALRIAKPGTHLLAFGGTRTFHRLTVAIEDAGWEIRDCIMWVYGSGFPKSHNLNGEWQGWGTALKPAWEPIIVARKPLVGTVAANVLAHGTGALNIDGCRVATDESTVRPTGSVSLGASGGWANPNTRNVMGGSDAGRWPANLIHDGSDEVVGLFPETHSAKSSFRGIQQRHDVSSPHTSRPKPGTNSQRGHDDNGGSAARFFYCAKASKADRDSGLDGWEETPRNAESVWAGECPDCGCRMMLNGKPTCGHGKVKWVQGLPRRNRHPTVKPNDLMRYLCRLVTPPGGMVLDPFCGSGSTGKAAMLEGFGFIGIELNPEYAAIAEARIKAETDRISLLEAIE